MEAVDGCGLEEVGEKGRKRVFFKRKGEQAANEARAFGTTTNIRRMEREGRKERRKEGKRAASILGSVCLLLFNSKQPFDTVFSTFILCAWVPNRHFACWQRSQNPP